MAGKGNSESVMYSTSFTILNFPVPKKKEGLQCDLNMELSVCTYRIFQRKFQATQYTSEYHLKCLFAFVIFFFPAYAP